MDVIKFKVENKILKCGFIDGKTKMPHNYNEKISREILSEVSKCAINAMHFTGRHIRFEVQGKRIEITNGLDLINDKSSEYYEDFRFVRKYIRDKNYVLQKKKQKTIAIGLSVALAATAITYIVASKANANTPEDVMISTSVSTTYDAPKEPTTIDHKIYVDSSKEELTKIIKEPTKKETEAPVQATTEEKTTSQKEVSDEQSNYIDMLGIGSELDTPKYIKAKELYYPIMEKYGEMYGVDPDIICAIATQERGEHSSTISEGGGLGLMQVQASVWDGQSLTVTKANGEKETISVTTDKLRDLDFNIKVGTAIYKMCLDLMHSKEVPALQCYNFGQGTFGKVLKNYSYSAGKSVDEILDSNDLGWINFTRGHGGDPDYVKNVLRYFDGTITDLGLTSKTK